MDALFNDNALMVVKRASSLGEVKVQVTLSRELRDIMLSPMAELLISLAAGTEVHSSHILSLFTPLWKLSRLRGREKRHVGRSRWMTVRARGKKRLQHAIESMSVRRHKRMWLRSRAPRGSQNRRKQFSASESGKPEAKAGIARGWSILSERRKA